MVQRTTRPTRVHHLDLNVTEPKLVQFFRKAPSELLGDGAFRNVAALARDCICSCFFNAQLIDSNFFLPFDFAQDVTQNNLLAIVGPQVRSTLFLAC